MGTSETPKRKSAAAKEKKPSLLQQVKESASVIILVIAVLLAYGGGRYIRTTIHEWVDSTIRRVLPSIGGAPRIWTIAPDSTGLLTDAAIYQEFLCSSVSRLDKRPPPRDTDNDKCVHIFLEVTPKTPKADMHKDWGPLAKKSKTAPPCRIMAMANTDQFTVDMLDLPHLELILCKTRQCVSWIQDQQKGRTNKIPLLYTGFTSRPPAAPAIALDDEQRFNKFLHVAGQSPHKGTWTILQAWMQYPDWPKLTITSYENLMVDKILEQFLQQYEIQRLPPNIEHITQKLPQDELDALMHSHGVHLCLSGMEGFGHYLNEARAVGALVLTLDHPAMNELITPSTGLLLEPTNMIDWTNGLKFGNVGAPEFVKAMKEEVLPMEVSKRKEYGERAKEAFSTDREKFRKHMEQFQCYVEKCEDVQMQQACAESCGLTLEQ